MTKNGKFVRRERGKKTEEEMEREGGNEGSQKGRRREKKEGEEGMFCVPSFLSCWGEP